MISKLAARDVVAAVAAAAQRWSDSAYPPRRTAVGRIAERTRYAAATVETALDRLFAPLCETAITAAIVAELGSLDVLDEFVERGGAGRVRAQAIGRTCVVSSRTTIGVAVIPAIFALCAGCDVLVKDRQDHLVAAFFATLRDVRPELAPRITAATWRSEDDAVDLAGFDCVVAFGNDDTLATIARRLPVRTRFVPHGTATSAGYLTATDLGSETSARTIARAAANDALLYDGEGCMSLHVLFVESRAEISPARFAEFLRDALAEAANTHPASSAPESTAQMALARDTALLTSPSRRIYSDQRASYLLLESADSPPLLARRALSLVAVDEPQQAASYLRRYGIALEALAVNGNGRDYAELAVACGAARITTFGALQAPPPGSPHGGRPCIAEFVRWIADET